LPAARGAAVHLVALFLLERGTANRAEGFFGFHTRDFTVRRFDPAFQNALATPANAPATPRGAGAVLARITASQKPVGHALPGVHPLSPGQPGD
jgi:hypothetical protein